MNSRRLPFGALRRSWIAIACAASLACGSVTAAPPGTQYAPSAAAPTSGPASSLSDTPTSTSAPVSSRPLAVASLDFVSEHVGWVATYSGPLYRMLGTRWVALPSLPEGVVETVDFVGTQVGWALARTRGVPGCLYTGDARAAPCRYSLLFTQDGGATWDERAVPPVVLSGPYVIHGSTHELAAIDVRNLWLLINGGDGVSEVRVTNDGGRGWRTVLAMRGLSNLRSDSARGAWVLAASSTGADVLRTTDGGATWVHQLSGKAIALTRVASQLWVLERDGAYCTASNCSEYRLSHSTDAGESWMDLGNPKLSATCSGGQLGEPSFSDRDLLTGYLPISLGAGGVRAGDGGLLITSDCGRTWRCEAKPPNVSRVVAVMGTAFAVSTDRTSGAQSVWRRDATAWTQAFP